MKDASTVGVSDCIADLDEPSQQRLQLRRRTSAEMQSPDRVLETSIRAPVSDVGERRDGAEELAMLVDRRVQVQPFERRTQRLRVRFRRIVPERGELFRQVVPTVDVSYPVSGDKRADQSPVAVQSHHVVRHCGTT